MPRPEDLKGHLNLMCLRGEAINRKQPHSTVNIPPPRLIAMYKTYSWVEVWLRSVAYLVCVCVCQINPGATTRSPTAAQSGFTLLPAVSPSEYGWSQAHLEWRTAPRSCFMQLWVPHPLWESSIGGAVHHLELCEAAAGSHLAQLQAVPPLRGGRHCFQQLQRSCIALVCVTSPPLFKGGKVAGSPEASQCRK